MPTWTLDNTSDNDCFYDSCMPTFFVYFDCVIQVSNIFFYLMKYFKKFLFSNTFVRISRQSALFWKCQRYHFVTAYEAKPLLSPPFVILSLIYMVIKYAIRLCLRKKIKFDRKLSEISTIKFLFLMVNLSF